VRATALLDAHAGWPCRSGCDACCRRLARVPELTQLEWEPLARALRALPTAEQAACLRAAEALEDHVRAHGERDPLTCPLLDGERGLCRVYASRPLACRSYGFYAGRSHDAWCSKVAAHVAPVRDGLIFGNLDALERDLADCGGPRRDLLSLLRDPDSQCL
jgi:Fe-S-cluster containining protein